MSRWNARRMSPSVTMPASRPSASTTATAPLRPSVTAETTSLKPASGETAAGAAALSPIHSRTLCRLIPRDPPGWCRPKSMAVKPRRSISTMARASPSARVIRVEVVGARPLGQASATLGMVKHTAE